MNIQDRIVKIITVIQNEGQGLTRKQLQEILASAEETGVDWNAIFDKAMEAGLLKVKNQRLGTLTYTLEGKKFCKKPYPINLAPETAPQPTAPAANGNVDEELLLMMCGVAGKNHTETPQHPTSARTKLQIKLIRAIDRKIALDDFAQSENIDLDELLDNLEDLRHHGKRMDISYFVNEVIGQDNVEEVRDSMEDDTFDMNTMRSEWGDVYNEEELRLLRYVLS